jgi:hypothetical protein
MIGPRTGATLVRGADAYRHFDPETARPAVDFDPAGLAAHDAAMRPFAEAIYEGAGGDGRLSPEKLAAAGRPPRTAPR